MENWCVDTANPRLIRQAQSPGHGVAKARGTKTGNPIETARFIAAAPETARRLAEAEAKIEALCGEVVRAQNRRDEVLAMLQNLLRAAQCMQEEGWRENPISLKVGVTIRAAEEMLKDCI